MKYSLIPVYIDKVNGAAQKPSLYYRGAYWLPAIQNLLFPGKSK
jgi:hypothetical protein